MVRRSRQSVRNAPAPVDVNSYATALDGSAALDSTPKGLSVHVNPARPPPPSQRKSITADQALPPQHHQQLSARHGIADKKLAIAVQQQRREPAVAQQLADDVPRAVTARPSVTRIADTSTPLIADASVTTARPSSTVKPAVSTAVRPVGLTRASQASVSGSLSHTLSPEEALVVPRKPVLRSREEQEAMRMREIERLNQLEQLKAQPKTITNEKEVAAAAADAHRQLRQPLHVALTARQATAEAHFEEQHDYNHLVKGLHERLGVVAPSSSSSSSTDVKEDAARDHTSKKKRLPSPAHVVGGVTNKVVALRRAEMAEMVARLRRMLAESNVAATPDEIPIIPAAGLDGVSGIQCPACDVCIEMNTDATIRRHIIPVLHALASERVVMPMAGRRGSVSVTSSAASENATTLDSFRARGSAHSRDASHTHKGSSKHVSSSRQLIEAEQQPQNSMPSRYTVPRCFRLEIVPFGLQRVSIHVTVHPYVAEHFYKAHARRLEHVLSLAIDPPFPAEWSEWTDAHRLRLLHRVIDDLLHAGPHPPLPSVTQNVAVFPAHVDATRDALWNAVWADRSLSGLLTIPEHAIASYFGTEVMFYYAWMNHYARWLLGAGVLGLVVSLLSSVRLVDSAAMAGDAPPLVFAPLSSATASALFFAVRYHMQSALDLTLLPLFIIVMILGSVLCIKTWERRCSFLTMTYHLFQQEGKDEPRHDFHGKPGRDPVTGEPQLRYPAWYRAMVLQPFAWAVIVLFMIGTIGIMICSLNLDGMVTDPRSRIAIPALRELTLHGNTFDRTVHPFRAMLTPLAYSVCIATLSHVFTALAVFLTRMENYRYRSEYVRALTLKRVTFEFVNSYAKLIYVAFGRSSMPELASNLQSILYVAVLSRLMSDTVIPFFMTHRRRVARRLLQKHNEKRGLVVPAAANGTSSSSSPSASAISAPPPAPHGGSTDSPLDEVDEMLDPYDVYVDVIEMIIQFGYILLFAAAYPLASFVALLSNMVEVRSDLFKMCYVVRRPVPRLGLQENATWCGIMRVFAIAAVITNAFLLAFTSHQMARWFPEYFATNTTITAVPYGSMQGYNSLSDKSTSAASVASLAKRADIQYVALEMVPGKGRYVMFYSMVMEHALGLVAVFLLWRIPSTPREVRHYTDRKLHQHMTRG